MRYLYLILFPFILGGCNRGGTGTSQADMDSDKDRCMRNMTALSLAAKEFKNDRGRWPTNLLEALNSTGYGSDDAVALSCPEIASKQQGLIEQLLESSYVYVDWSKWFGLTDPPSDFPLLYERRLNNHGKAGINVVLISGEKFWDTNADRIRNFASDHPDYHLIVP